MLWPELTERCAKPHIHTWRDTEMKFMLHEGTAGYQVKEYPADFKRQSTAFVDREALSEYNALHKPLH
ncbi:unnamed protein product [Bubo scandiacus]